ncbi:EF hand domain-containing protein [Dichotomicrobium thermohalophilum]|uniref:EF hand domain-containing protein n=2 Tax=Dichotomicrobium thermohalophilum TaxID=933063 RepID=A0A397Q3Q2_9HYPH|nr:EF hand domain-containing protein [Dichotomicrobium thermohalophilum]
MYGKSLIAALAVATIGLAGLGGLAVAQDENGEESSYGRGMGYGMGPGMMGRGMMMHHGMTPGMMGRGMMGQGMWPGMMGRGWGMMHGMGPGARMRFKEMADADEDGRVSEEEAANFWKQQVQKFDADGDGNLSLQEFAEMHAAHTRPMMVDRFQFFDDDGDATVTLSELQAPFERMNRFMGRNDGRGMRGRGMMRRGMHQGMGRGMGRGYGPGQQERTE